MSPTTYSDLTDALIGWDFARDADKMTWTGTTVSGGASASYSITDEMLMSNKTFAGMKKELQALRAEVQDRGSRTATEQMIMQQQAMDRMKHERDMLHRQDAAQYAQRALATKPSQIAVLDANQFSQQAAKQFAMQNPNMQVMVAPNPEKAIRFYPDTFGVTKPAPAKPLSSTRPDQLKWKYANL